MKPHKRNLFLIDKWCIFLFLAKNNMEVDKLYSLYLASYDCYLFLYINIAYI